MFDNADYIHRYTRADAIRDGVLIDVSAVAREAGIVYPVALTAAVWARCVAVPAGVECQDEQGRLWKGGEYPDPGQRRVVSRGTEDASAGTGLITPRHSLSCLAMASCCGGRRGSRIVG
jgi:hypothetical protein